MTIMLASETLAHPWVVMPMAILSLLVVAGHLSLLARSDMPPSRVRIRTANGLVMLLSLPVAAYALAIAKPAVDQRAFVIAWTMTAGMITIVLLLALLDIANTWRLHRREVRVLRERLDEARREALARAMTSDGESAVAAE